MKILEDTLARSPVLIEEWFEHKFSRYTAVLSSSVDMRSSSYKVVPVDVNFFPAGYNNLGENAKKKMEKFLRDNLSKYAGGKALVIIESHTRNKKYVDSVIVLTNTLSSAGFHAEVGMCDIDENCFVTASSGASIEVKALEGTNGKIGTVDGFMPDFVVLNNDLTSQVPGILTCLEQEVFPSTFLGWCNRSKYGYFDMYEKVVCEFCNEFRVDPWLISALFSYCREVDFVSKVGIDVVASAVEDLLSKIREKFLIYGIKEDPYVFIKADNGTYGMGITNVRSGDDVVNMNKKDRNKMRCIKEGNPIKNVVLQEGVPTDEVFSGSFAEPLLYYIGQDIVGYLYRYNRRRSEYENLNVPGCGFIDVEHQIQGNKKHVWGFISKLAVLASAQEAHKIISGA